MRNKVIKRSARSTITAPFLKNFPMIGGGSSYVQSFQFEEALVLDVIVNDKHPNYDLDGYNVGAIKFRFLTSQVGLEDEGLTWALPLDTNITRYPLLNEIVWVVEALNRYYYFCPFNISNRPTSNAIFGLDAETKAYRNNGNEDHTQKSEISAGGAPIKENKQDDEDRLGDIFKEKADVFRLRAQEGDFILEGRSGHSIRFGANFETNQSPNILIRAGQNPEAKKSIEDSPFAVINEDINVDPSSIWMVTNQNIPIKFATIDNSNLHFPSMGDDKPSTLDGNQIVINSDRLILNAKGGANDGRILITSFLGTHFASLQDHTVDAKNYISFVSKERRIGTGQNYVINVGKSYLLDVEEKAQSHARGVYSITSDDKIIIGSDTSEEQPLVLGERLHAFMKAILDLFNEFNTTFTLPTIGVGPLNPGVTAGLKKIKQEFGLDSINAAQTKGWLSKDIFASRTAND